MMKHILDIVNILNATHAGGYGSGRGGSWDGAVGRLCGWVRHRYRSDSSSSSSSRWDYAWRCRRDWCSSWWGWWSGVWWILWLCTILNVLQNTQTHHSPPASRHSEWVSRGFTFRPTQHRSFRGWPFQAMHIHIIMEQKSLTCTESL